jgi:hypothetical protein
VLERQFGDAQDFWDGNWVHSVAKYERGGSCVTTAGPFLHLSAVARFIEGLRSLNTDLTGTAALDTIEPNLRVEVTGDGKGHLSVVVDITPDNLVEEHQFREDLDQTFLPELIASCEAVLTRLPLREPTAMHRAGDA